MKDAPMEPTSHQTTVIPFEKKNDAAQGGSCRKDAIIVSDSSSEASFDAEATIEPPNYRPSQFVQPQDEALATMDTYLDQLNAFQDVLLAEQRREQDQKLSSTDACLAQILEFFPDIAHSFVRKVYKEKYDSAALGPIAFDATIDYIFSLNGKHPKQKDATKADEEEKDSKALLYDDLVWTKQRFFAAKNALALEFPLLPVKSIYEVLKRKNDVHDAYLALAENLEADASSENHCKRLKRPRPSDNSTPTEETPDGSLFSVEIKKAKAIRARLDDKRRLEFEKVDKERKNEQDALEKGEMAECRCCFNDVPINRMAYCDGQEPHLFCWQCIKTHTESGFGQGKSVPKCMDQSGCKAVFADHQLRLCLPEASLARLLRLQQQDSLRAAELEGLEECPYCDFLDICPPVESDREFRCKMSECMKISCRLCKEETHIPLSCEESKTQREKEKKIDARHFVEEAMTAAMVRECNKCKNRFVKLEGCNKMHCTKCGNLQCYVCSTNIKDYTHFSMRKEDGKCPTHDDFSVEKRHHDEVKVAEEKARAKIQSENPDITPDDLAIKVSEAVRREEEGRIRNVRGCRNQWIPPRPPIPAGVGAYRRGAPVLGPRVGRFPGGIQDGRMQFHRPPHMQDDNGEARRRQQIPFQAPARAVVEGQGQQQPMQNDLPTGMHLWQAQPLALHADRGETIFGGRLGAMPFQPALRNLHQGPHEFPVEPRQTYLHENVPNAPINWDANFALEDQITTNTMHESAHLPSLDWGEPQALHMPQQLQPPAAQYPFALPNFGVVNEGFFDFQMPPHDPFVGFSQVNAPPTGYGDPGPGYW